MVLGGSERRAASLHSACFSSACARPLARASSAMSKTSACQGCVAPSAWSKPQHPQQVNIAAQVGEECTAKEFSPQTFTFQWHFLKI
eukprot:1850569-Amphidinium_carterae.1